MILSILLGGFLLIYTVGYTYNRIKILNNYKKAKELNELRNIEGYVCEKVEEVKKTVQGITVNIALPKYCYMIGDKKCYYQSSVKFQDLVIGEAVEMEYCERTGEVWVTKEIPLIKRNLMIRVPMILFLIALLIITETVL